MFDFSDQPYNTGIPFFDVHTRRYVFWLDASEAIYNFASKLPMVQRVFRFQPGEALWIVLDPLEADSTARAYDTYRAILASIDAHLDPPLSETIWREAIERAFDEYPPF